MPVNYSPSININRDLSIDRLYIPTKNSIKAYDTIATNFKSGLHSYNIIGSYGTGKSAFLLAFNKHLNSEETYFKPVNGQFNGCSKFHIIQIVGSYESLISSLARELGVQNEERTVYDALKDLQNKLKRKNECLVLIIDEFGKSLEYAAKNEPERELYFIQRIAEYANDSKRNFLFITTLHQNFDAYALGLEDKDRKEWEKVKGRIKEIPFNEPVEQMLELAGEAINSEFSGLDNLQVSEDLISYIKSSNLFRLRNEFNAETNKKLFPLEPLSASCLLIALQKYGQNERSLFSFISTEEPYGLRAHVQKKKTQYYSVIDVFDFLQFNFSHLLHSKHNPDYFKWRVIFTALDRVDALFSEDVLQARSVVKIIGLLDIVNQGVGQIGSEFLELYCNEVVEGLEVEEVLKTLENKGVIKYHNFKKSYAIYEGTDIDIEYEIDKKRNEIGSLVSIKDEIGKHIDLEYLVAKSISYLKGTPRIFEFKLSEQPIFKYDNVSSEIDGYINVVLSAGTIDEHDFDINQPISYCFLSIDNSVMSQLTDIYVVNKLLIESPLDKVAKQELVEYGDSLKKTFTEIFKNRLFSSQSKWFSNGVFKSLSSEKELNREISLLANQVYHSTPVYRNELINKSKLSGTLQHSKKKFISALLNHTNTPHLGFSGAKFPPERTIYHSLLEDTGIHYPNDSNQWRFQNPTNKSFKSLWDVCNTFINDSKQGKRPVSELIDALSKPPFKLKDGFLEFWIISFLFIHREDFALYMDGAYLPTFSPEVGDLLFKKGKTFAIKGIDVDGVRLSLFNKYRGLINKNESENIKNKGFQEIAKPFLVFYKQLSPYSKQTKKYIADDTSRFRETLLNAKELEKTFFEDLPKCFGYSLDQLEVDNGALDSFAEALQSSIKELRIQDSKLADRVMASLKDHFSSKDIDFDDLRILIQNRYRPGMEHLLDVKQKNLFKRIHSQIPESNLWLSSIVQILMGKPLTQITDKEEVVLYNEVNKQFNDLDALVEIAQMNYSENDLALRYEIQGSDKKHRKNQVILSHKDLEDIEGLKKSVSEILLKSNVKVKEGLLIQMLKELENE